MENLKSPLNSDSFKKIDEFFYKNKESIISKKHYTNLDSFIQKNPNFGDFIDQLTASEKTRAWFYLHKLSKSSMTEDNSQGLKDKSLLIMVGGFVFLLVIVLFFALIFKPQEKENIEIEKIESASASKALEISQYAYTSYSKEGFPKTYAIWGDEWVAKFPEMERKVAQKIANASNSCDAIEIVSLSDTRSLPKQEAVFFVDCSNGERFYVSQNELDITAPVKSQSEKAVSQDKAFDDCMQMVKMNTKYPSSINFKILDTNGFTAKTTGNVVIILGFEAKNSLGAELPAKARCVFTPDGEKGITITEG